jgi:hypothetical protein
MPIPHANKIQSTHPAQRACAATKSGVAWIAAMSCLSASAGEYPLGEGQLTVHGSLFVGAAVRIDGRDATLLPDANARVLGLTGDAVSAGAGRNQDDGNLNFGRGDAVAKVVKGHLSLSYRRGRYGFEASGQGWYDAATERSGYPWGNEINGFVGGARLGDSGALSRSKFSGAVLNQLYAYGTHDGGPAAIEWRVGYQNLLWGRRFMFAGGLRDLDPVDLPALVRPGVLRDVETRTGIPLVLARVSRPDQSASVEAYYQWAFEPTATSTCGTFFAQLDFLPEGCNKAMFGVLSDRTAVATGVYVDRGATVQPSDSGQAGVALRWKAPALSTEFGLYAAQLHSRMAFYSGYKSQRTDVLFVPGNPDGGNPNYFTEYPERIRMYGASFESRLKAGLLFGEITYRPNQPLQYNPVDVIAGSVSQTAPTPLRDRIEAVEPGALMRAWERHRAWQVQLAAATEVPGVLGSAGLSLGAELIYKRIPGLPDPAVERFGRSEVFGQGPVDGICPPPAAPVACSFDGYVSKEAYGYRLRASLRYPRAIGSVELVPSVYYAHDVHGWAGDWLLNEGRQLANVSLQARFGERWSATAAWLPTWGGTYNNMRDRSVAQAAVGYQF